MIPTMTAITARMMPITKPAVAPPEECFAGPWADVDVAVEDVDEEVEVAMGLPPYGQ